MEISSICSSLRKQFYLTFKHPYLDSSKPDICECNEQCYCEAETRIDSQEFPFLYGTRKLVTMLQESYSVLYPER